MELIIGGAFQGKLEYAKAVYPEISWVDGAVCTWEELETARGVYHFEQYIRRIIESNSEAGKQVKEQSGNRLMSVPQEKQIHMSDINELAGKLISTNPDLVVVCDEVGYGVVPIDASDRNYRESVGRVCTKLASFSGKVHRVVCGVGTVIKNA